MAKFKAKGRNESYALIMESWELLKSRRFRGVAQPVVDPGRIARFLELRLKRHPKMIGEILKTEGLSAKPSRAELEAYAGKLAMVIIRPQLGESH